MRAAEFDRYGPTGVLRIRHVKRPQPEHGDALVQGVAALAAAPAPSRRRHRKHGRYVTLYGKHGGRTIRVGRRTWDALQQLAADKEPDEPVIAISDERIRQILTAAAEAAGLKKKLSPHWPRHAHGSHAHQRGAAQRPPSSAIRSATHRSVRLMCTSVRRRPMGRPCI